MATVQFSIRMDAEIKARLDREARLEDRSAAYLTQKAVGEYLGRKEHLRRIVTEAEARIVPGNLVSEAAVDAWMASWDGENELPMPAPDGALAAKKGRR